MLKQRVLILFTLFCTIGGLNAQVGYNPILNCVTDVNGECVPNAQATAMPFLLISPDARSGGMGDVGIASPAGANAMNYNASNLVFAEQSSGVSFTLTPWLRELQLDDVYLFYGTAYTQIDNLQAIGLGLKYFSLGDIQYRGPQGTEEGIGMPRDLEVSLAYARKLGTKLSAGLTGKFLYSDLASGQSISGIDIVSARSFAADLSLTYRSPMTLGGNKGNLTAGLAITNIGAKVSYENNASVKDFIPTNLGLGVGYDMDLDAFNSLAFMLEFNKLLVPSVISKQIFENGVLVDNPEYSKDGDDIADYRQKTLFQGILGSFSDAQGGFSEELREIAIGVGVEYWYNKQFALRTGYFYENELKGNRKFFTAGLGVNYNVFGLNISYLIPTTNQRSPLDNTLRFSLMVDLGGSNGNAES